FFSSRRRHTRSYGDWSSDVCSSDLQKLMDWLGEHDDLLTAEVQQKRATNVLRVFDVKDPKMRALLESAPKITDHLCGACEEHFRSEERRVGKSGGLEGRRICRNIDR